MLFKAVQWILACVLLQTAIFLVLELVVAIHNRKLGADDSEAWSNASFDTSLAVGLWGHIVLIYATAHRGRIVGGGNLRSGLGLGPILRPRLLIVLAALDLSVSFGWAYVMSALGIPSPQGFAAELSDGTAGVPMILAYAVSACVLAPISEELFFRAWLWTGLRRHWSPWKVGLVTGIF